MDVVLIYEYHLCRQRIQIGWEVEMFDRSRKNPQSDQNPVARRENMSVTISGNETLVYDREKYVIHRLSAVQAGVWNLADGSRTLANLTHDLCEESGGGEFYQKSVARALSDLEAMGLLETQTDHTSRWSRRWIVGGAVGAAASGTFISAYAGVSHKHGDPCSSSELGNREGGCTCYEISGGTYLWIC